MYVCTWLCVVRLPPVVAASVSVLSTFQGTGVVAADVVQWNSVIVSGDGVLITAGTSWSG